MESCARRWCYILADKFELSISQRKTLIFLWYKKDNPKKLDNWRPISLLNIDHNILAH